MTKEEQEILRGEISKRLLKALEYNGVKTAAELQRIIGTPHATANNYFQGKRIPTMEYLSKLTQQFDKINIRWILTGKGKMNLDSDSGPAKLENFSDREILTYIKDNQERFKGQDLTKRVFDVLFIDEWIEELDKQYEKVKSMFEKKHGLID